MVSLNIPVEMTEVTCSGIKITQEESNDIEVIGILRNGGHTVTLGILWQENGQPFGY